ncbi:hypothetical protein [Streptomyces sp. CB01881]|uniref:hypothetical protein n=1 Tax=Streptomyces sp. CB01881 TaxID=2078691 RepID=UPI000CDBF614|nr:hypothetical protein [Streptomyces sp. CB01881]AUY50600.1 hypothetical protein C2142_18485 [Streptomyces sp. CB01881]TYC73986.1 hypothetical protein EH183_18455 [Streptomyces sp. CB01881]
MSAFRGTVIVQRVLGVGLVAAAALGLTACGPDNSSDQAGGGAPATTAPATTAPTAAATGSAAPTGGQSGKPGGAAKPSAGASDGAEGFCDATPLPAGQKWVYPVKGTTATTLVYKDTKTACGVNDVVFQPTGADKSAPFAPTVKGHLNSVMTAPKDVNVADLVKHIGECLADPTSTKGFYPCSAGDYKIAIDSSGKVVEATERAHS